MSVLFEEKKNKNNLKNEMIILLVKVITVMWWPVKILFKIYER